MRPCKAWLIHHRALHYQALVKPSSAVLLVQAAGKGVQELVSHRALSRNLVFDKTWNGKGNGTLGTGDSPALVEWLCSTSWPSSPANKCTCKTPLVRAGMGRQALLIKLFEIWKKSISHAAEEEFIPIPKGELPHFDCMSTWRTICRVLLSERHLQSNTAQCNPVSWGFVGFFSSLIFAFSPTLPLWFIVSFPALISQLINKISYWLGCSQSGQDLHFQLIKPVRIIC